MVLCCTQHGRTPQDIADRASARHPDALRRTDELRAVLRRHGTRVVYRVARGLKKHIVTEWVKRKPVDVVKLPRRNGDQYIAVLCFAVY